MLLYILGGRCFFKCCRGKFPQASPQPLAGPSTKPELTVVVRQGL